MPSRPCEHEGLVSISSRLLRLPWIACEHASNKYECAFYAALQDAEVFRQVKGGQQPQGKPTAAGIKRTCGVAFGSGAADEDDSYGMMEDYVADDGDKRKGLLFEIAEGSDEEDMPVVMGR